MGKSTNQMAIFNSKVFVYQMVNHKNFIEPPWKPALLRAFPANLRIGVAIGMRQVRGSQNWPFEAAMIWLGEIVISPTAKENLKPLSRCTQRIKDIKRYPPILWWSNPILLTFLVRYNELPFLGGYFPLEPLNHHHSRRDIVLLHDRNLQ